MPKIFTHENLVVDQEFRQVIETVDDLVATEAGLVQSTATPGGPAGGVIPPKTTQAWTVGVSIVGGADTIGG